MSPHVKISSLWVPFAPSKAMFSLRAWQAEDLNCLLSMLIIIIVKVICKSDPFIIPGHLTFSKVLDST